MIVRRTLRGARHRPRGGQWAAAIGAVSAALALAAAASAGPANPSPPGKDVAEALTNTLAELVATPGSRGAGKTDLRRILKKVAVSRQEQLADLVDEDPGAVLRLAMPADQRARFPRTVRRHLEKEVELEGVLEVLVEDRETESRVRHHLTTARGRRFSLHFADDPPPLTTGDRVRARGIRLPHTRSVALASGSMSVQTLAAAVSPVGGAQRTLVILVNFQDDPTKQPYTLQHAQNVVFNTTSGFYFEASFEQTWLSGDVYGWFTIPVDSTSCNSSTISSAARSAAAAAGADLSAYTRYVYAFPNNACTWWGLGTVGGNPSHAWINGSLELIVAGHELGHNFGLYHSNALDCGSLAVGNDCTAISYGDRLDIMGRWASGHFNAFQKSRLGWIDAVTADTDGTYWASPYESGGSHPTALAILKSTDPNTGKRTWYYLEHRQAMGFDSFLGGNTNVLNGVVIHTGSESSANSSYALDMTPLTSSWSDPALIVGDSFHDAEAGVTITPLAVTADGIGVEVSFGGGGATCVSVAPSVTVLPSETQWVPAGTTAVYDVTVTNNDSTACAPATFDVTAGAPAGWTATTALPALGIAPGRSAATTVEVTSPASAVDGLYDVTIGVVSQTDPSLAASATASHGITSGLDVTTWTDQPSYNTGDLVSIWTLVETSGVAVSNTDVALTIGKPDGTIVTKAGTTSATGYLQVSLRLGRKDPGGTYDVTAEAGAAPGPAGSATTAFSVTKVSTGGGGGGGGGGRGKKQRWSVR